MQWFERELSGRKEFIKTKKLNNPFIKTNVKKSNFIIFLYKFFKKANSKQKFLAKKVKVRESGK